MSAANARRKHANRPKAHKKRRLQVVDERFELGFNAAMASAIVFQQAVRLCLALCLLVTTSPSIAATNCKLFPDLCQQANNLAQDLQDEVDNAASGLIDDLENEIDQAVDDAETAVDNAANDAVEQLQSEADAALQKRVSNLADETSAANDALSREANTLIGNAKPTAHKAEREVIAELETTIGTLEALESDLAAKASALEQSAIDARQQTLATIEATKQAINDAENEAARLKARALSLLESEANRVVKNAQREVGDLLNLSAMLDLSADLDFSSDSALTVSSQSRHPGIAPGDMKSWSAGFYQSNGSTVLPLGYQLNRHSDVGISLPFEHGTIDRGLARLRFFANPWRSGYAEVRLQHFRDDGNYFGWGTKVRQSRQQLAVALDYSRGALPNAFDFVKLKGSLAINLTPRHTLVYALSKTTFTQSSVDSVVESTEAQLGTRVTTTVFNLLPSGIDFDLMLNLPQLNSWRYRDYSGRIDGLGWSVDFGFGLQF